MHRCGMEKKKNICNALFAWLYRISMLLFTVSSPESRITSCELMEYANITCYWTAHSSENVSYMMQVNTSNCVNNKFSTDSCTTTNTRCSVKIGSVSHCFCVNVLAFTSSRSTRFSPYCFNGINEVKMYTPTIKMLATVPENGSCLKLEWKEPLSEYMPSKEKRFLQIEYKAPQQADFPKVNADLHDWQMQLCGLYPGTTYSVRVRAQHSSAMQHWSSWSDFTEATTMEAAPVAAPELWRHIEPADQRRQRRLTLLWKPLRWPQTNGVILRYAASCQDQINLSYWDCDPLDSNRTSCVLSVSAHACNCQLTTSNSAGTSPSAHIHIPGEKDTEPRPPDSISVLALGDFQLKVEWAATVNQSEFRFVVEWFRIHHTTPVGLYWIILNSSEKSFIITEGVHPKIPYNVSVRVLHNNTAGAARSVIAFTRQGAPSVGPDLKVHRITSNDVTLRWRPVPMENLHGFIQNYTVMYKYKDKLTFFVVSGDTEQMSLNSLSPGQYSMCVTAHTLAGAAESPWINVTVGKSAHIPVVAIVLCTLGGLFAFVILLGLAERIQHCLCPVVPDPSKSSLSAWPPVSPHQLPVMSLKTSSFFEPICMVRGPTGSRGHHREDPGLQWHVHKQAIQVAQQTFSEVSVKGATEELITDFSYQNGCMDTPQCSHHLSFSCPDVPQVSIATLDPAFCKNNTVPRSPGCQPLSKSCLRVDHHGPDYLFYRTSAVSKLKAYCGTRVSTSYLPVADSYIDFQTAVQNSSNLICKSKYSPRLESCCYSQVSGSYLPMTESSSVYADFVTVNTTACHDQNNDMSNNEACGYIHVSTNYPCD